MSAFTMLSCVLSLLGLFVSLSYSTSLYNLICVCYGKKVGYHNWI